MYIHTYSFITQNDRMHLHKITNTRKNTTKAEYDVPSIQLVIIIYGRSL